MLGSEFHLENAYNKGIKISIHKINFQISLMGQSDFYCSTAQLQRLEMSFGIEISLDIEISFVNNCTNVFMKFTD